MAPEASPESLRSWLILAVLLGGCGSGGGPPAASTGPSEAEATQPPPSEPADESPPSDDGASGSAEQGGGATAPPLAWRLEATPTELTMAARGGFRLRVVATNRGTEPASPELHRGTFTVNGARSMAAGLAFSNGVMEAGWMELGPGESVATERALGEALFTAPGSYEIHYARDDGVDERVTVTVR